MSSVAAPFVWQRVAYGALALACGAGSAVLAAHHPLLGLWAVLVCGVAAAVGLWAPGAWPLWLLPLLPLVGAMPWTGWLVVEELDLLALAAGAGGYLRWACARGATPPARWTIGAALGLLLLALYGVALGVSMQRGVADAGGLTWGWWQGYHEPLNSVRLVKAFVLANLLLPLWLRAHRVHPERAARHLLIGVTAMLALVALSVVWERVAYTGLTNFSTDYRVTGPFWEMHVGGAALDAVLALSVPFAMAAIMDVRRAHVWVVAAAVLALAAYASLVTFSRVVYIALPLSLAVLVALRGRQAPSVQADTPPQGTIATLALLAAYAAAAAALFASSGYRGLLALLGVFALALPLGASMPALRRGSLATAVATAVALVALCWMATLLVPKGAYLAYAIVALTGAWCVAAIEFAQRRASVAPGYAPALLLACTLALCAGVYLVATAWGGEKAAPAAAIVAGALLAAVLGLAVSRRSPWPASLRWQVSRVAMLGLFGLVVGVFSGGNYMGARWSTIESDLAARQQHARGALALLRGPLDELFGRGLGRYAAAQSMSGLPSDQTGDYRWLDDSQQPRLLLTSGKHILGWGELFRISQRIAPPGPSARLEVRVRSAERITLHAEVCEKHLLYNGACITGRTTVAGQGAAWQTVEWMLNGYSPTRGSWYAPRTIAFSLALESEGSRAEFGGIDLYAADGRSLLRNGAFRDGMAHWFFTSDRHHLPWHAKNLAVHLLFEQGIVGCTLFALLGALALWRLTVGSLRTHLLAPALAAAMVGLGVVGTADSLLDMPRVAFLIYVLLGMALLLRPKAWTKADETPTSAVGPPR